MQKQKDLFKIDLILVFLSFESEIKLLWNPEIHELPPLIYVYGTADNVWCIKNQTSHSSKTLQSLIQFLMHQTLVPRVFIKSLVFK